MKWLHYYQENKLISTYFDGDISSYYCNKLTLKTQDQLNDLMKLLLWERKAGSDINWITLFLVSARFLMTAIAIRNLVVGLPPAEQLRSEVAFANMKEPEAEANPEETLKQEVGHAEL